MKKSPISQAGILKEPSPSMERYIPQDLTILFSRPIRIIVDEFRTEKAGGFLPSPDQVQTAPYLAP